MTPCLKSSPYPPHAGHASCPCCKRWTIRMRWPMLRHQPTIGRSRSTAPTRTSLRADALWRGKRNELRNESGEWRSTRGTLLVPPERTASDPHRRGRAELLPERLAVAAAFEDVAVAADQAPRGVGLVEKKLDAEPAYAERPHPLNVLRGA